MTDHPALTKTKHSPGPWWTLDGDAETRSMSIIYMSGELQNPVGVVRPDSPRVIGYVRFDQNEKRQQEDRANARLIAAAPDLLEACKSVAMTPGIPNTKLGRMLRDAIAMAEGGDE